MLRAWHNAVRKFGSERRTVAKPRAKRLLSFPKPLGFGEDPDVPVSKGIAEQQNLDGDSFIRKRAIRGDCSPYHCSQPLVFGRFRVNLCWAFRRVVLRSFH